MTPIRETTWRAAQALVLAAATIATAVGCGDSDEPPPKHAGVGGAHAGAGSGGAAGSNVDDAGAGGVSPGVGGTRAAGGTRSSGGDSSQSGHANSRGGSSGRGNSGGTNPIEGGAPGETAGAGGMGEVDDPTVLKGRVVDFDTNRGLPGRTVMIGSSLGDAARVMLTTDEHGEFKLARPLDTYDVAVIEPDGSSISLYARLAAAKLVLPHRTSGVVATQHQARVSGTVSGGTTYPLSDARDVVNVYLFNDESTSDYPMGGGSIPYGPDYFGLCRFDSTGPIANTLVALGTFGRKDDAPSTDPAYAAFAVTQRLKLSDGDDVSRNLELEAIDLGTISGTVTTPSGIPLTSLRTHYRFPYPKAIMPFVSTDYIRQNPLTNDGAFVYELPALDEPDAALCLAAESDSSLNAGALWTERCGLSLDADPVSLALEAAPTLAEPMAGTIVDDTTLFSWSAFAGGVHRFELRPRYATAATPDISVYTAATETTFPDLAPLGLSFPTNTGYVVTITGIGPAASLDEALDPSGPFAVIPNELRLSASAETDVQTRP
jgi:hypothetical protein